MTQRQSDSLDRIDGLLRKIANAFVQAQRDLLSAITGELPEGTRQQAFPAIIETAIGRARRIMTNGFAEHARWGYESAVNAMLSAIPKAYLLSRIPEETKAAFEAIHHPRFEPNLNFDAGMLSVSTEDVEPGPFSTSIPIRPLGKLELTDEEVEELIRKIVFPPPSAEDVTAALRTSDWEDRLESLSRRISDKQIAFGEIVRGYSEGEGVSAIKKRLEPLVGGIKASAQRIARTEGMRVAETMQRRAWEPISDMMTGVQIIAVLDANTRPEHATRNGEIYYNAPRGNQKSIAELPDLPDAPNCRCMTTPVLKPPAELESDPAIREAFRATKGSGRLDAETHDKWFASATEKQRKQVVGVRRYAEVQSLVGDRQPEWSDFVDEDGQLLTRTQLRDESVTDRQARKEAIKRMMERRGRAIRELSRRGFEWPRLKKSKTTSRQRLPSTVTGQEFGSNYEVSWQSGRDAQDRRQQLDQMVPGLTETQAAKLTGSPSGARIETLFDNSGRLFMASQYRDGSTMVASKRLLYRDPVDGLIMENEWLEVVPKRSGLGVDVFARQIKEARKIGVQKIVTIAARGSKLNGYYTWARLGYDGPIPMGVIRQAQEAFPGVQNVSDMMTTQERRDWWRENGTSFDGEFDLSDGSQSRKVFDAYYRERRQRARDEQGTEAIESAGNGSQHEEDVIDIDAPIDSAILDEIWDDIASGL